MHLENVIVGGGIAGTTIAVHLQKQNSDFILLESSRRLGGKIETKITPEACFEFGPNAFANHSEEIFDLLDLLGLKEDLLEADPAAQNRYILKKNEIVRLPRKPPEILTSQILSPLGRLRFLREIFYVPPVQKSEESVRDFFERHFGPEVANYFADPFVTGIFAGDASRLSLKEAFPTMAEAEAKSSSLIRYLISERKTAKANPTSHQLKRGLESIFHRALEKLGQSIHLEETVQEIIPQGNQVRVITNRGEYETERLYLTSPAFVSSKLLQKKFPEASKLFSRIEYAPVITIHMKVSREESFPFNGFGILLPSSEKRQILGVLWNSTSFPSLFPDKKHHYLTIYAGGVLNQGIAEADEAVIRQRVTDEVTNLFKLKTSPEIIHVRRHPQAIPQYNLGYGELLKSLLDSLKNYPQIKLAGNYIGGTSLPKVVAYAASLANS